VRDEEKYQERLVEEQAKVLAEDALAYEYDRVYDGIENEKKQRVQEQFGKLKQSKEPQA